MLTLVIAGRTDQLAEGELGVVLQLIAVDLPCVVGRGAVMRHSKVVVSKHLSKLYRVRLVILLILFMSFSNCKYIYSLDIL